MDVSAYLSEADGIDDATVSEFAQSETQAMMAWQRSGKCNYRNEGTCKCKDTGKGPYKGKASLSLDERRRKLMESALGRADHS